MKALALLKHNIDAILKERRQTRRDLAQYVRQSFDNKKIDPWISHIFTDADAEFQMKYLDRIADFFGVTVYQLFQPGISHLTERRKSERRTGRERRLGTVQHRIRARVAETTGTVTDEDVSDLLFLKRLGESSRATIRERMHELERSAHQTAARGRGRRHAETAPGASTVPANQASRRRRGMTKMTEE
jgi:hypothetical protein